MKELSVAEVNSVAGGLGFDTLIGGLAIIGSTLAIGAIGGAKAAGPIAAPIGGIIGAVLGVGWGIGLTAAIEAGYGDAGLIAVGGPILLSLTQILQGVGSGGSL